MRRGLVALALVLCGAGCFRLLPNPPARGELRDGGADGDAGPGDADAGDGDATPIDGDAEGDDDADEAGPTPPECVDHAECDNGIGCDGAEGCVGGVCVAGLEPVMDDGVGCTVDACAEPRGWVTNRRDSSTCPAGTHCFGDSGPGCVACPDTPCVPLLPQCGCPEGEGCYIGSGAARYCGVTGTLGLGEACSGPESCTAGLACLSVHSGLSGPRQCYRPCLGDLDCFDAPGNLCLFDIEVSDYSVCSNSCDPATLAGCHPDPSVSCMVMRHPRAVDGYVRSCTGPVGTAAPGEDCADDMGCARGLHCVDPDGVGGPRRRACSKWCRLDDPSTCGAGERCTELVPPLLLDRVAYGVCL